MGLSIFQRALSIRLAIEFASQNFVAKQSVTKTAITKVDLVTLWI